MGFEDTPLKNNCKPSIMLGATNQTGDIDQSTNMILCFYFFTF